MGTDITMYYERRYPEGWYPVSGKVYSWGRPYSMFSVLHGRSIGGWSALAEIPYLTKPRGFPDDIHPDHLHMAEADLFDDPDHGGWGASWLLARELVDFDWDQPVTFRALVREHVAPLFDPRQDFPREAFPNEERVYSAEPRFGFGCREIPGDVVEVAWSTPLREYAGCAEDFIQRLLELGPPDDIRIIYWFDN